MDSKKATKKQQDESQMDIDPEQEPREPAKTVDYATDVQISFKSAEDIQRALDTSNVDLLIQGFMHLREHLKICNRSDEDTASSKGQVLRETNRRIVYLWAEQWKGFPHIQNAWELAQTHTIGRLEGLVCTTAGQLLCTLNTTETLSYGMELGRLVLDNFMRAMHRSISTPRSPGCASALQLLRHLVEFGDGALADQVRQQFDWTMKSLKQLPLARSRVAGLGIRRLWIRFVMSFFAAKNCQSSVEILRMRSVFGDLFLGVEKDSYFDLYVLLTQVFEHVVMNQRISRGDKRRAFGAGLMGNLAKAARRNRELVQLSAVGIKQMAKFDPENTVSEEVTNDSVAALVVRFFRGMMTHPGYGICYRQYGLYPAPGRQQGVAAEGVHDVATVARGSSAEMHELCNSQILYILIRCIRPEESRMMAELATDILRANPELIAPFWRSTKLPIEPRVSVQFLGASAFALNVMRQPLPTETVGAGPPQVLTLVEHIAPAALKREQLGRGLQMRGSPLVQYRTLLLIDALLSKLDMTCEWIGERRQIKTWHSLEKQLVAVVRQRMPGWKLILTIHHDLNKMPANSQQRVLLSGVLVSVMRGYQQYFSELILETRFEFGQLLAPENLQAMDNPLAAHVQLHVLNALACASNVQWLAQTHGQHSHTNVGSVLSVFLFAAQPQVRWAAQAACKSALVSTALFDHDAEEAQCWLDALAALTSTYAMRSSIGWAVSQHQQDQAHMVISFLENAIMQASKQPYKHADRVYAVAGDSSSTLLFSPLLSALVESAIAMLAADAKNMLKETEPAELDAFVTREIQGNIRFRLVREVACRIAEERGANAARALAVFLESVPAAIVAQRIAQIKDASNSQVTSKSHLIAIQKQISLLARMEFLAALYEPASKFETAKSVSSVSRVLEKEMQDMLDWGCGDIGARLDLLLERLGRVIGRIPLEKISQWLINWTLQMGAKRHGQAALAPVVRWIALYCRTGAGSHSIWDFEPFIKLAAQLPPVDDLSFMEALMRHLLISNRLGEHISRPAVQRLLAHLMLATRGSLRFSILIAWLLQRIAIPNAGLQLHGLSFVSALLVEHLELLATADKQLLVLPKALELFAPLLSKSLFGSSDFQQMIDSTATDLVRRTADSWLSKQEATRIWTPLVEHIVGHIESAAHHNADMRPAVYWLTFLRLIVAIVPLHMRESLVRTLSSITVTNVQVLCATAKTVFALRALDTSNQDMPTSVLTVERRLASQVLQQWAASLNSSESSLCQLLENAALKATVRLDVRLHVEANSQKGVCELQRRLRAELVQPNSSHLLSSDDIIRVLDMLWASTSSATSNNADANNWLILGRILRSDGMLRLHASRWIDQAASHGLNQLQGRTLAWLVAMIGTECHYFTSRRLSIWDDDESAQSVHKCLLNLVHRLFTDRSECLNDIATDDSMFRIVREFVQHSCDHNAVLQFYIQAAPLLAQPCAAEKRIALLQAMIQRTYLFTSEPDTLASLFNEVLQMAQAIIPSIGSARPASTELRLLSQLETAMQCCQHATAKRHIQDVNALLAAAFTRISQIVESLTIPFEEGVDLTESQIQQYVYCYPSSIFRLLAFAVYSVTPYASSAAAGKLEWFTVLRRLLNCRLFAKRAYDSELRDHLALFICGLWKLARPHISPWSASLNDYFTLDELEALAGAYAGSCSTVDQLYLQVIREYETATRQSVMRVLLVFGPLAADSFVKERINRIRYFIERDENDVGVVGPDIVANALAIVDGGRMLRLITEFPLSMDLVADENCDMNILQSLADSEALQCPYGAAECSRIYNAQVMLPWLWAIVSSGHLMDIKRLIDTNALSLAIVSLSSQSERMRKLAYFILDKAYAIILQDKHTLFGKSQCIVLLDVLRNSITERTSLQFPQIPYTLTLFAALSLPITLRPEHTMYAPINRLLLRRPWLRTNELPLLRLVTQPSDTSVACRTFVLRMASQMARAFGQATDVFRRTDWLNTVLALSSSSLGDVQTGMAALRTIFNLSSADNSHILPLYVSKSRFSVLAWIKAQLQLELCSLQSACALVVTGSLGEHQGILEGNNMASVNMALANVIALIRVITRVIANFSLSQISSGQLIFNKFWIVQTPEQLVAPGQSAVLGMLQQTLTVLAQTLTRFKGQSFNSIYVPALTLVYSCMTAAHMLAEIQFGSTQSSSSSPALQSSQLVPAVLSVIRKMEHIEHPGIDVLKESMHNYDPCKVASIAHAQSVDSLFAVPTFGAYSLYAKCIDQLFSWILSVPGLKCMPNDMLDLVSYALAVGSPTTERAVGWIRECRGY